MNYGQKESAILEFKRDVPSKKTLLIKTIIAFANTYGGELIVGVDDTGEIIGVPELIYPHELKNKIKRNSQCICHLRVGGDPFLAGT